MNREGKKCVIYVRVSTDMQIDGFSLDGQRNTLKRFVEREGMILVNTYEDAGKSGKSIEGRPAFQNMLKDIQNGLEIDYVLVYKLSRFGRNAADILNSLELIQSYDINLIATEEGIDSSQTSGKLLISVLSAVSEIERENIIEQTMNGRKEKARQGGWNGGFAPYGYSLINGELVIEPKESEVIKKIFAMYLSNDFIGPMGIAKELNMLGIKKKVRQNGSLEVWTRSLIKNVLDNPVYAGKIAFGRRKKQRIKGTKNLYETVRTNEYILADGNHEAIIDIDTWEKVCEKRKERGVSSVSSVGYNRIHLLTGVLKCPRCGGAMYAQKNSWIMIDGTYKENFRYQCLNRHRENGHQCDYSGSIRKENIEPFIVNIIKGLITNKEFAAQIKELIGCEIDTSKLEDEKRRYEAKLNEILTTKEYLEREIDNQPLDNKHRDRIIKDLTKRLYGMYDSIDEIEQKIKDVNLRISGIKNNEITIEKVFKILANFNDLYDIISDQEKKELLAYLIKEIHLYEEGTLDNPIKSIVLNFPVDYKNQSGDSIENEICLELSSESKYIKEIINDTTVEIEKSKKVKVTYKMIQEYVLNKYGFKVHTSYIAEVKRSHGLKMYDAPNAVETLKNPRKHPTQKAVKAIEEALNHFEII